MGLNWSVNRTGTVRERFAGPLSIGGLLGIGLALLVMLYPEKILLELLSTHEVSSPAQQSYLEALSRLRPGDNNLLLLLSRSYVRSDNPVKALAALDRVHVPVVPETEKEIRRLRYGAYHLRLKGLRRDSKEWLAAREDFTAQIEAFRQQGASMQEMAGFLADARDAGDEETVTRLEKLLGYASGITMKLETGAAAALADGDYRKAAAGYFEAMNSCTELAQRRRLYLAGVGALQSGNMLAEAVNAADRNLGVLANDRETLVFLSRLAIAANRPDRAQIYIRRVLGMTGKPEGKS